MAQNWRKMTDDEAVVVFGKELDARIQYDSEKKRGLYSGKFDFYDAGSGFYFIICFGNDRNWGMVRNEKGHLYWAQLSWDEVAACPGCPPNFDIPF